MHIGRILGSPRLTATLRKLCGCFALMAILATSACATVKPYEREDLARKDMEFAGNPDASAGEQHAVAYREGSSGGFGASGGGCGCN